MRNGDDQILNEKVDSVTSLENLALSSLKHARLMESSLLDYSWLWTEILKEKLLATDSVGYRIGAIQNSFSLALNSPAHLP
jgi:hypothetical protein